MKEKIDSNMVSLNTTITVDDKQAKEEIFSFYAQSIEKESTVSREKLVDMTLIILKKAETISYYDELVNKTNEAYYQLHQRKPPEYDFSEERLKKIFGGIEYDKVFHLRREKLLATFDEQITSEVRKIKKHEFIENLRLIREVIVKAIVEELIETKKIDKKIWIAMSKLSQEFIEKAEDIKKKKKELVELEKELTTSIPDSDKLDKYHNLKTEVTSLESKITQLEEQ